MEIHQEPPPVKPLTPIDIHSPSDACFLPNGDLFVLYSTSLSSRHKPIPLIKLDRNFNILTKIDLGLKWAHTINATSNGTYLISDTKNCRILEIDQKGKIVNEITKIGDKTDLLINGAIETPDKNILLTTQEMGYLLEIDRKGNILWSFMAKVGLHDATILKNNNILVTSLPTNEVFEIGRDHQIKWLHKKGLDQPKNARRMPNGNTIITHKNGIFEVTPTGEIVNENNNLLGCYNFKILKNNQIMLSHSIEGILFLDRRFRVVRSFKYHPPSSWKALGMDLSKEEKERFKAMGYLQ